MIATPPSPTPGQILEAWTRLSSAETEAIEANDWAHLGTLQEAKSALRQRLDAVPEEALRSNSACATRLAEILERERTNLALLERRRADAARKRDTLERTRWNLRRQMGSFGSRSETSWQQYS
ncbi:MAG: hypothetical protein AB7O66_24805 [Limisphaerales bacterium]